jgi:hypothetical protein
MQQQKKPVSLSDQFKREAKQRLTSATERLATQVLTRLQNLFSATNLLLYSSPNILTSSLAKMSTARHRLRKVITLDLNQTLGLKKSTSSANPKKNRPVEKQARKRKARASRL